MTLPLVFSFWFLVAAYVVHVIEESLLGGSFVEIVRQHWWPEYNWRKFFGFNYGLLRPLSREHRDSSLRSE